MNVHRASRGLGFFRQKAAAGLLFLVFASGTQGPAFADDAALKISGEFLQQGIGARAEGMGEAQAGVVDDGYALAWNPAGLARMRQTQFSFMHNSWFGGIFNEYLAYAQPIRGASSGFGLSLDYVNYGSFDKYGIDQYNFPVLMSGTFTPVTFMATFGYGMEAAPNFVIGAAAKLISESVDTYNNLTVALDAGLQILHLFPNFDLGFAVQNLGLPMQGFGLPLTARLGAGYQVPGQLFSARDRFTLAVDEQFTLPANTYTNAGLEYWIDNTIAVRAGYRVAGINALGSGAGLSAGMGVRISDFTLDYALTSVGEFGYTHRVSFTVSLGKPERRVVRRRVVAKHIPTSAPGTSGDGLLVPKITGLAMRTLVGVKVSGEISPQDKTALRRAVFEFQLNSDKKVEKWDLQIVDPSGKSLKELGGTDLPPRVEWDGKDPSGRKITDAASAGYRLTYTTEDGTTETLTGKILTEAETAADAAGTPNRIKLDSIYFEESSADLSAEAVKLLTAAAKTIKGQGYAQIVVEGFTDGASETRQEFILSQRRSDTVVRYLATNFKIPFTDFSVHARGTKSPAASNQTDDGRAKNRRVEITILYRR